MYPHHKESLEILVNYFKQKEEVIAVVFGGSVAKGMERPDSDLDAMIIVTPEAYEKRKKDNTTVETIEGMCTYKGGYFDVKYMTKEYIQIAAKQGSEPTRNSFVCAKVLYSKDKEIEDIVAKIPVFPISEKEEKQRVFYSNFWLNYYYFWKGCKIDGYMRVHALSEIMYSIYRLILQENEILFPSNRRLEETVEQAPNKPENIIELGKRLADSQLDEDCDAFVKAYLDWTSYKYPQDSSQILTSYSENYEQWWFVPRPFMNEW